MKELSKETITLLGCICSLVSQYMPMEGDGYCHQNMTAGENAVDILENYGLAVDDGRCIVPNKKFEEMEDLAEEISNE